MCVCLWVLFLFCVFADKNAVCTFKNVPVCTFKTLPCVPPKKPVSSMTLSTRSVASLSLSLSERKALA